MHIKERPVIANLHLIGFYPNGVHKFATTTHHWRICDRIVQKNTRHFFNIILTVRYTYVATEPDILLGNTLHLHPSKNYRNI